MDGDENEHSNPRLAHRSHTRPPLHLAFAFLHATHDRWMRRRLRPAWVMKSLLSTCCSSIDGDVDELFLG